MLFQPRPSKGGWRVTDAKGLKVGVAIEETWDFFREIYAELERNYSTRLFRRRQLRFENGGWTPSRYVMEPR